jgi:GNAT superfamily N-acetyltransferase
LTEDRLGRAHRNLVDSSRRFFELDPDAVIEAEPGWLLGAGSPSHPVISNAAFRRADDVPGDELVARANAFFAALDRRFTIWVKADRAEDDDMAQAAAAAGFRDVYGMPEMLLDAELPAEPLPAGAELRRLETDGDVEDFWRVAKASYATNGFPPEVFAGYTDHSGLFADDVAVFLARIDGEPVAIAMTIVSDGVAGIYWVGSVESARGRGLGRAVTVAATRAGRELGGELASLQASPMGRPIYAKLGYETAFEYRLLLSPER